MVYLWSKPNRSLAVSIGEALLVNGLKTELPKHTDAIPPEAVVKAGALNLAALTNSAAILQAMREAYAAAIRHVLIFALAIVCLSVPAACGMQWLNLKQVSRDREEERKSRAASRPSGEKDESCDQS